MQLIDNVRSMKYIHCEHCFWKVIKEYSSYRTVRNIGTRTVTALGVLVSHEDIWVGV